MANTTYYVDTDIGEAGDGSSWESAFDSLATAEALNLNITTGATEGICTIHCKGATADAASFQWAGWTTSAAYYIHVVVDEGDRHQGVYSESYYRVEDDGANGCIYVYDDHIRFEGVQFVYSGVSNTACVKVNYINAGSDIRFDSCIFNCGGQSGIEIDDSDTNLSIYNCIFFDASESFKSAIMVSNGTIACYNNTIVDCYYGIRQTGGTVDVDMNLVSDCTNCFDGTFNGGEYNAYTEGADPANNGQSVTRGTDFAFVNYDGDNFHIDASLDGTTDQSGGLVTEDIDGDSRSGTFDIGADEYGTTTTTTTAAPSVVVPLFSSRGIHSTIFGGQVING